MLGQIAKLVFVWLSEYLIDTAKVKIIFQCEDDETELKLKAALQQDLNKVTWHGDKRPLFSELKNVQMNGIAMYFPGKF